MRIKKTLIMTAAVCAVAGGTVLASGTAQATTSEERVQVTHADFDRLVGERARDAAPFTITSTHSTLCLTADPQGMILPPGAIPPPGVPAPPLPGGIRMLIQLACTPGNKMWQDWALEKDPSIPNSFVIKLNNQNKCLEAQPPGPIPPGPMPPGPIPPGPMPMPPFPMSAPVVLNECQPVPGGMPMQRFFLFRGATEKMHLQVTPVGFQTCLTAADGLPGEGAPVLHKQCSVWQQPQQIWDFSLAL